MKLAHCASHNLEECPSCGTYASMSERIAKQVIVMRKDLNMRKGKMVAQGAHASLGAVWMIEGEIEDGLLLAGHYEAFHTWKEGKFTKICVSVDSEGELLNIFQLASIAQLPVKVIEDSGATEFNGVPTLTCLAIGPAWADEIDKITGHLPLL